MSDLALLTLILHDKLAPMVIAWWLANEPDPEDLPERDDDNKRQARRTVQTMIKRGELPAPGDVICMDCTKVPAREYDHFKGYGPGCHTKVQAVCAGCHHKREADRLDADN